MHLLSCKNPHRVYNQYTNEYIWVPCGQCAICRNRRASHYTNLLERERLQHRYCYFITLTYSDENIPCIHLKDFGLHGDLSNEEFLSNRPDDDICIPYSELFPKDRQLHPFSKYYMSSCPDYMYCHADIKFFDDMIRNGGLNYCSKTDLQKFLKRLNKYIHDKITNQYKNFRYFLVSEFGSTTLRGHAHGIFYFDNDKLANEFKNAIVSCWQFGRIDCKPVESSACSYCAQYINKSADLPYVYTHKSLRPFFLCSRNPFIGSYSEHDEVDAKVVYSSSVTTFVRKGANSTELVDVPLQQSYQNRLFPKCPSYGSVSDFVRTKLYSISRRFPRKTLRGFLSDVYDYMVSDCRSELCTFFRMKLKFNDFAQPWNDPLILFDEYSFNWLRRLFYFGRKVARQACQFGLTLESYIQKIFDYYNKKELYLLKCQYEYQAEISSSDCDCIALMYPDFLFSNGLTIPEYVSDLDCSVAQNQIDDAEYFAFSNKKTHFKNAYLDSLKETNIFLFNVIKTYLYAKKCNEALEAFATSCA